MLINFKCKQCPNSCKYVSIKPKGHARKNPIIRGKMKVEKKSEKLVNWLKSISPMTIKKLNIKISSFMLLLYGLCWFLFNYCDLSTEVVSVGEMVVMGISILVLIYMIVSWIIYYAFTNWEDFGPL